jgi:hypothetical protein
MSTLELPDLHEYLERATFCANVELQKANVPKDSQYLESSFILTDGKYSHDNPSSPTTIRLIFSGYEDVEENVHYHFDFERTPGDVPESFDKVDILKVIEVPSVIEGALAHVYLSADFAIPLDECPARGMIPTLLGVETKSCGYDMSLSGAEMAIDGGDVFTKLKWSLNDDTNCINAHIEGFTVTEISSKYLVNLANLMDDGLHCFILETQDELASNVSNKPMPATIQPQKKAE